MARQMKDSGIEWVGEIPAHWETRRIKNLFVYRNEKNYKPLSEVNLISLYTDLGVVQHSDLESTTGNKASNADGYKLVYEDDIVVNIILCWMGAIGRSAYTGVTSPAYDIYAPMECVNSKFYHYLFRTKGFSGDCYKYGRGIMAMRWRTYSDQFRAIRVVVPPLDEQKKIAEFLDKYCAEIDSVIAKTKATIEEYKKLKQSIITEAVTKGIRGNRPMKDSGVKCIGNVPAEWKVMPLKYLYDHTNGSAVRVGPFGSSLSGADIVQEGVWVYTQRTVLDKNFETNDSFVSEDKAEKLRGFEVKQGDILVTTRGTLGKTAIVPTNAPNGILHPCVIRFRIDETKYNKQLLSTVFNESGVIQRQILDMSNSTTIEVLYSYSLKEIKIPVPSLDEQVEIVCFVEKIGAEIDTLIAKKTALLAELETYKKSVIYEYVTGKKEVL